MSKKIDLLDDTRIFKKEDEIQSKLDNYPKMINRLKTYSELMKERDYALQKGRDAYFDEQKKTRK